MDLVQVDGGSGLVLMIGAGAGGWRIGANADDWT